MPCPVRKNGYVQPDLGHAFLQVQPAQPWHLQVQHQITWRLRTDTGQEFLGGGEGLGLAPRRTNETSQTLRAEESSSTIAMIGLDSGDSRISFFFVVLRKSEVEHCARAVLRRTP